MCILISVFLNIIQSLLLYFVLLSPVPRDPKIIIKPSTVPEQSLVGKDPCQSEHGLLSKGRLSTLEQLQYKLTTQVIQAGDRDFVRLKHAHCIDTEDKFSNLWPM